MAYLSFDFSLEMSVHGFRQDSVLIPPGDPWWFPIQVLSRPGPVSKTRWNWVYSWWTAELPLFSLEVLDDQWIISYLFHSRCPLISFDFTLSAESLVCFELEPAGDNKRSWFCWDMWLQLDHQQILCFCLFKYKLVLLRNVQYLYYFIAAGARFPCWLLNGSMLCVQGNIFILNQTKFFVAVFVAPSA